MTLKLNINGTIMELKINGLPHLRKDKARDTSTPLNEFVVPKLLEPCIMKGKSVTTGKFSSLQIFLWHSNYNQRIKRNCQKFVAKEKMVWLVSQCCFKYQVNVLLLYNKNV